jgi:glycosyltransferase involved in cell wall biosynthesis
MKIGCNLLYLIPGKVGGTETYARELLPALAQVLRPGDEIIVYCSRETAPTFKALDTMKIRTVPVYAANRLARLWIEQTLLPFLCWQDRIDVIFSLGYSAPLLHHCPSIVTIHDLNWFYHAEDFGWLSRLIWKWLTIASARWSNHIVTDSQASARSIEDVMHIPKSQITPVLHGTPAVIQFKSVKQKDPYILTVVAGYPHKNLATLLRAFSVLRTEFPELKLLVCGLGGKADAANDKLIQELGIAQSVRVLGYVDRRELASLYGGAAVFVFPSAYEGFGYPVVEAMSYGVPVVSSNAFSLQEVVEKGGVLVEPYDVKEYVDAIRKIMKSKDEKKRLIQQGRKRAAELQWEKTARKTLAVMEGLIHE